uniref:Reverse transcriptase domain-containing protein n=1 Tax=Anolis carolinensis TaxID=28377 RepID=A0A803SUI6_ANOCA
MIDIWRMLKGNEKRFTFHSMAHQNFSRIDYFFVSPNMLPKIVDAGIGVIKCSDHALISLDFQIKKDYKTYKNWKVGNAILENNKMVEKIAKELGEIWEINDNNQSSYAMVWDTMKAVTRGLFIKEACNLKREQEVERKKLELEIQELEKRYVKDKDKQSYLKALAKRKELEKYNLEKAQRDLIYTKREYFEYSNRNSKMLARAAQDKRSKNLIGTIRDKWGREAISMKEKLAVFQEFYQKLYTAVDNPNNRIEEVIDKYLKIELQEIDKKSMEQLVSEKEIEEVIDKLKGGKTPGMDGLGPEYYKKFKLMLVPKFKELYNRIMAGEQIPPSWQESRIILILKPNKDPTDPGSYRPISLINQDAKILTAIMAKRINSFIYNYIQKDQCGFIPGRNMSNLVGRVLNIIHKIKGKKSKAGILALDIFKAFDCVSWTALKKILEKFGLGERFRGLIDKLYSTNYAAIQVNDGLTEKIRLTRGTRQGCPLSPTLFAIVIEILANMIREDTNIKGIGREGRYKICLFADDTLLSLENPIEQLKRIETHLTEFGEVTGLQVNWNKSEILLFNYTKEEEERIREGGLCRIKIKKSIKYLGINISNEIGNLERDNIIRLRKNVKDTLAKFTKLKLSWFGRIALIKMKILPKINFLFRMLPIKISTGKITNWQNMINTFCNGNKRARINKEKWYKIQKNGGLGIPNLKLYYMANQLRYIIEGIIGQEDLEWLEEESKDIDMKLENIFFIGKTRNSEKKWYNKIGNPFLKNILEIWAKYEEKLIPPISPLTPVLITKNFPMNLKRELERTFKEKGMMKLKDWESKMKNLGEIRNQLSGSIGWYKVLQLERWAREIRKKYKGDRELTKFEKMISQRGGREGKERTKGITSDIYKLLIDKEQEQDHLKEMWELDCNKEIHPQIWKEMLNMRILKTCL